MPNRKTDNPLEELFTETLKDICFGEANPAGPAEDG